MASFQTYPRLTDNRFGRLTAEIVQQFIDFLGKDRVFHDSETLFDYSHDWTEDYAFPPDVVLKPETTEEVAQILKICSDNDLPVTPAGARTGLSGGMLPIYGGVLLSLERMNKILQIDEQNLQMTVQAGVITQHIHQAAENVGLMYPPDPSSMGSCFIGGNIASNAGGTRAVKYGITREYVLALTAVLPTGEVIYTGAKVLKNSTGYNLTQLLVGSEGTLAVITEAVLKLVPLPAHTATLLIPFRDALRACDCVSAIFHAKVVPSAVEFIEIDAIKFGQDYLNLHKYPTDDIEAHLLIQVDGATEDETMRQAEIIASVAEKMGGGDILFAVEADKQNDLWRLRRCLGEAVKGTTIYKEEDAVVPRAELARLLQKVKAVGTAFGFYSVCYGHAGDGNLHINIIKGDMPDDRWHNDLPQAIEEIFRFVVSVGGTLSGEHGIGYVQRRYMPIAFSETEMALMKQLKAIFDPKGILNPGKMWL